MKKLIVIFILAICFATSLAIADNIRIPKGQFDSRTRLWLARAMIGEAGWFATNDHVAIAYVLKRRWEAMRERWPKIQFKTVILAYAKALGGGRREYTARQIWVRGLRDDLSEPRGWPQKILWRGHKKCWRQTLQRVDAWQRGELADPCRGRAFHWGSSNDIPGEKLFPVDCGETVNTFYGIQNINKQGDNNE